MFCFVFPISCWMQQSQQHQGPPTISEGLGGTWGLGLSRFSRSLLFLCNSETWTRFWTFCLYMWKLYWWNLDAGQSTTKLKQTTSAGFGGGLGCEKKKRRKKGVRVKLEWTELMVLCWPLLKDCGSRLWKWEMLQVQKWLTGVGSF